MEKYEFLDEILDKGFSDANIVNIPKKVFHPYRIMILKFLSIVSEAEFYELKYFLGTTDGNLASNLRVLKNENYIFKREDLDALPKKNYYQLTSLGYRVFRDFFSFMKDFLDGGYLNFEKT